MIMPSLVLNRIYCKYDTFYALNDHLIYSTYAIIASFFLFNNA